MSGLVGYGTSDEEDDDGDKKDAAWQDASKDTASKPAEPHSAFNEPQNGGLESSIETPSSHAYRDGNFVGPTGPLANQISDHDPQNHPLSPHSANRAAIRSLTLPTVPNLDIPPSPSGTPPPGMDRKFQHFLDLKRQGVHFNQKLANSSALKNPSLLQKLMDFAGLEDQDQYCTSLPEDVWDPKAFPSWAYKEELAKSQQAITKKMEEKLAGTQRERIEFVSATNSVHSSRGPTQAAPLGTKGPQGSAAERVMAGLDSERQRLPQAGSGSMRSANKGKGGKHDGTQSGISSRTTSRSPKRRKH